MKTALLAPVKRRLRIAASLVLGVLLLSKAAASQPSGELLYANHCIACHTTQVHWRDKRLATTWRALRQQVARWQDAIALNWSEEEITEVTRYLDERYYRFPPSSAVGDLLPAAAAAERSRCVRLRP